MKGTESTATEGPPCAGTAMGLDEVKGETPIKAEHDDDQGDRDLKMQETTGSTESHDGSVVGSDISASSSSDSDVDIILSPPSEAPAPRKAAASSLPPATSSSQPIDINAIPTVDGQSLLDMDPATMDEKPWRKPGADITDYFNYGFNEQTWKMYCAKQKMLRDEFSHKRIGVFENEMPGPMMAPPMPPEMQMEFFDDGMYPPDFGPMGMFGPPRPVPGPGPGPPGHAVGHPPLGPGPGPGPLPPKGKVPGMPPGPPGPGMGMGPGPGPRPGVPYYEMGPPRMNQFDAHMPLPMQFPPGGPPPMRVPPPPQPAHHQGPGRGAPPPAGVGQPTGQPGAIGRGKTGGSNMEPPRSNFHQGIRP